MAEKKNNIFIGQLRKVDGKLVYTDNNKAKQYEVFNKSIEEGQYVDIFLDSNVDDGTLAQLAVIYRSIRQIAIDTGSTFEDTKFDVKRLAGLCIKKEISGEMYMICKSFSKISKEESSLVIQAIIQIGETIGIDFTPISTKPY